MEDRHAEQLSARTRELMAESGLSWNQAWRLAEDEELGFAVRIRHRASGRFAVLWLTVGFLLALVPGVLSQIMEPNWATTSSSRDELVGWTVYWALLAVLGLGVIAIGLWFGLRGRSGQGGRALLLMYVGVVPGTWMGLNLAGSGFDVELAAFLFALLIGIPYWLCAALGIVSGVAVYRVRRRPTANT